MKTKKSIILALLYMMLLCVSLVFTQSDEVSKLFIEEKERIEYIDFSANKHYTVNNLEILGDTFTVTGQDPYVIIDDAVGYIESIDLEATDTPIVIYYDKGNGFNEEDTVSFKVSEGQLSSIPIQEKVSKIRIDFDEAQESVVLKQCAIKYGTPQVMGGIAQFFVFYFIADVGVLFLAYALLKKKIFAFVKECPIVVAFVGYAFTKGLFGICYGGDASISVKVTMLLCNIFLVTALVCKLDKEDNYALSLFLSGVGFYYLSWVLIIPFNQAPDEQMRYLVPQYIYRHGALPRGEDPEIMNELWGFSYGFTPGLSYYFSALCMKIGSFISSTERALLIAARIPAVLFSVGTVGFSALIGRKLFSPKVSWLMPVLIAFLPQFAFISAYVNCDAIALFTISWIIYTLIIGGQANWQFKHCLSLGCAIGVCMLSYYNAYGIIVVAIIYAVTSVLRNQEIENKGKFLITRIIWVAIPALLVAGWWFLRNYILYQDILGFKSTSMYGEMYAIEELKPSNRTTPFRQGTSLIYMLFDMGWIVNSWNSFIGRFGYMDLPIENYQFLIMSTILLIGMYLFAVYCVKEKKLKLFDGLMILMCVITICLSIYYSYFNDYQPQGRYCLSMWISLAYLVTKGYSKVIGNSKVARVILVFAGIYCLISIDVLINVVMNHYVI